MQLRSRKNFGGSTAIELQLLQLQLLQLQPAAAAAAAADNAILAEHWATEQLHSSKFRKLVVYLGFILAWVFLVFPSKANKIRCKFSFIKPDDR